ncbi:nuclear transport factor 2 family protein [Pseudonocardia sp. KRD291]|uniref:nuclear transport factor 2 family protein n=1 Tax=Pseudonocardia sp. KRD291 TaxID=2792007 RepID=UPI001C49FB06|nr:nuclear transport factor 2 family protein [Pseudonocardia sp. KRD291]MBW0102890.1 nuclear transport factor 2 family protein [Pseudonocardia sp. KRD291]
MEEDNHITDPRTRSFVAAVRSFEQDGDPSGLVALFSDDATATRLDAHGEQEVAAFWQAYRDQFDRVSTTFRNAVEAVGQVALEWDSDVVLPGGRATAYSGVTILDFADDPGRSDSGGGVIARLRTYYDTAALVAAPAARA